MHACSRCYGGTAKLTSVTSTVKMEKRGNYKSKNCLFVCDQGAFAAKATHSGRLAFNSIVVSALFARGNTCYTLHEIKWCYSGSCFN